MRNDYEDAYKDLDTGHYYNRVKRIYEPKVDFLIECFETHKVDYSQFKFLDVGAGSGHFVSALDRRKIDAKGIEISASQVNNANRMNGKTLLEQIDGTEIAAYVQTAKVDTISFMGVFEHIINLHEVLECINKNNNIKFVYFSVPLFSFSCIVESANNAMFNRQLGGEHTHLFSIDSLQYLCQIYNWSILGKWQFGQDMFDLMRSIFIRMDENENEKLKSFFMRKFSAVIDDLQIVIDKSEFSSEIHMLVKK